MNREIKFRVWLDAIDPGEMVYPEWIKFNSDGTTELMGYFGGISMQFTGLKDKNGKEIYEGDLLRFSNSKYISEVVYKHGAFWVSGDNFMANDLLYDWVETYTVVGNIFENPELLTSEEFKNEI